MGTMVKAALAALAVLVSHSAASAQTMPESCTNDLTPMMQKRNAAVERIRGLNPKRTTAAQACAAFRDLTAKNKTVLDYLSANKEWCQVPDEQLAAMTQEHGQIDKNRGAACNAAAKQAAQIKQMQRQQQQGGGQAGVGSGVRLPQGAL